MVPMPAVDEMIRRIGRGSYITTADVITGCEAACCAVR